MQYAKYFSFIEHGRYLLIHVHVHVYSSEHDCLSSGVRSVHIKGSLNVKEKTTRL